MWILLRKTSVDSSRREYSETSGSTSLVIQIMELSILWRTVCSSSSSYSCSRSCSCCKQFRFYDKFPSHIDTVSYLLAVERTPLLVPPSSYPKSSLRGCDLHHTDRMHGCRNQATEHQTLLGLSPPPSIRAGFGKAIGKKERWDLVFFASGLEANAPNRSGCTPVIRNLISYKPHAHSPATGLPVTILMAQIES
jgi:hypothetical protein